MIAEHGKVPDALSSGAQDRRRCRGGRGLKPEREEHNVLLRMLPCHFERIERGIDHANPGASCLRVEERAASTRYAQRVPEGRKDDVPLLCEKSGVVDAAHRDYTHGASGSVDERQALGQVVLDAVLVDRMRVASADLHHLVGARPQERGDLLREALRRIARTVLVYKAHGGVPLPSSMPCTSSWSTW